MAVMVFTVLNGLAVIFLLYVLVQFWKEQHRPMKPGRGGQVIELSLKSKPTVLVVTHPISTSAHGGICVVSKEANRAVLQDAISHGTSSNTAEETPMKRFSTR